MELTLLLAPDEAAKLQRLPSSKPLGPDEHAERACGSSGMIRTTALWPHMVSHWLRSAAPGGSSGTARSTPSLGRPRPIIGLIEEVNEPRALSPSTAGSHNPGGGVRRQTLRFSADDR